MASLTVEFNGSKGWEIFSDKRGPFGIALRYRKAKNYAYAKALTDLETLKREGYEARLTIKG